MKYKSGRERSIAVAANFPNFVNKLPGTKILKRIVKVLNLLPLRFIPLFFPPFADCEFICFLSQRKQFSTPRLVSLLISLLFFFPRLACHAYRRNNKAILSSTTLSRRENFTGKRRTRVKIDINTKNICMSQSWASKVLQAAKVFLGAQQQLLVNGFSRRERNTTVNSHPDEGLAQPFHRLPSSFRPIKTAKTSE